MIRHASTWLTLAAIPTAGLLLTMMAHAAATPATPESAPSATLTTVSSTPPATNTLGSDGGVSMSIDGVECGHPSATGEYCSVTFHAVNVSDGFPVFTEADQLAYDASGHAVRPDPVADLAANDGKPITQRLPRGPVVSGVLVFAMPPGDQIDHLVLHGKPGTPGEVFGVRR